MLRHRGDSMRQAPCIPLEWLFLWHAFGIDCCLHVCRADEVSIEEQVRKFSATEATAGAKTLCIPLEQESLNGAKCFFSGKPAKNWALWGRSY